MKVLVFGWDCASPQIVFEKLKEELPNVRKIMEEGYFNKLLSCHPPITVPAWQVMLTGKSPAELGIYGFRERVGYSYTEFSIVTSGDIKEKRVWDIIGEKGKKSILSGIPPTYPPFPVNGYLIPCFITPDSNRDYTYPTDLKKEIEGLVGDYPFDVKFRTDEKEKLKRDVFDMTEKHFKVFEYLLRNKEWDFAMHVEIGLDRVHHGFWRYFDPEHHLHEPDSPFKDVIPEYYKLLDKWLGRIIQLIDEETLLLVVSDHGAKRMKGAFCVNQWLEKIGYLKFKEKPKKGERIQEAKINWKKTKAWGWGGYYSRIFFNVKGRERGGIIKEKNLRKEIEKLKKRIVDLRGPDGERWDNRVYTPDELYENPKGNPSDLIVYWDNLSWRAAGTVGHDTMYLKENDTGPDDGVHDWYGIFMAYNKKEKLNFGKNLELKDVFDIIMEHLR